MGEFKRTTVTAALIYANGPIHIGHLAGCYLPADAYVRYLRLKGHPVVFISGTDEHGVPITIKAQKEGKSPQDVVDHYYAIIKDSFEQFGISFDTYGRTTSQTHRELAQDFFLRMQEQGCFVEETTMQYYDAQAQQFLADRYIVGECPSCHQAGAYGDQCEKCGTALSPTELINPTSTLSGNRPELKATKNWFLPLDQWQERLEAYIAQHPEWKSNVLGQVKSWLNEGLKPRAMTRDLNWGIPLPLPDTDGKVLYVWFDAPIGYISMTKELREDWELYWKSPDSRIVHFIGKDNIVFHTLIFPAMCMAHGEYQIADQVPANEFMNLEGEKISTSRNWAVWLHEYLQDFPGKQDVLRYVLTSLSPENKDADFTWSDFLTKNNSELVGILGNFANRAFVLLEKHFNSQLPELAEPTGMEAALESQLLALPEQIAQAMEQYRFREALALVMDMARLGNKYLADTEPWKLIKTQPAQAATVLNRSFQVLAALSIAMEPFMPFTSNKLSQALGMSDLRWEQLQQMELLAPHTVVASPGLLFEKLEEGLVQEQMNKLNNKPMNANTPQVPEFKEPIGFDQFLSMDLRLGRIVQAERVEKSKKLLKLQVEDGHGTRTIMSGIAEHYAPEDVLGRQVCFLANLSPRNIMGVPSEGMILMASNEAGELSFLQPDKDMPAGASIS